MRMLWSPHCVSSPRTGVPGAESLCWAPLPTSGSPLGPAPAHHLKDGEVLQDAIHHVALRQLPQLVQEIHQVLAHGRAQQAVHEPAVFELGTLRLNQGTGSGEDGD